MPPEELERRTKVITETITQLEQVIVSDTERLRKVETLSKLATGGKRPDYDKFTDQELRDIFDVGIKSTTINNLPDGTDTNTGLVKGQHPYSTMGVMENELNSRTMSREDLVEAVDSLLKHNSYDINPMVLAEAQIMMISAGSAAVDGNVEKVMFDNMNLETEQGEGYKNEEAGEQLKQLKSHAKEFARTVENTSTSIVQGALHKQLGAAQGKSAEEVAGILKHAKGRMDATDMSGGTKSVVKVKDQNLDLSGANLKGVDLSKSDLTGMKIDPRTLSQAKGISQVRGVEPNVKMAALAYQSIDKMKAEFDKLKTPSILDRIKSIIHGGIEGAKENLVKKMDQAKMDVLKHLDPTLVETMRKQNLKSIDDLQNRQGELLSSERQYTKAEQQLQSANLTKVVAESAFGGGLSSEERRELRTVQKESRKVMSKTEGAHDEYQKNESEIESLKRNTSVRDTLGSKEKTGQEGPKVGQSVKI